MASARPSLAESNLSPPAFPVEALVDLVPGVVTIHDAETARCSFVGPGVESLLGLSPLLLIEGTFEAVLDRVDPADRVQVEERLRLLLRAVPPPGQETEFEYRYRHPDGRWLWLRTTARALPWSEGGPRRILGVTVETTQVHAARATAQDRLAQLERSTDDYRRILETSCEGVVVLDPERVIRYANRRLGEMIGCPAEALLGRHGLEFVAPECRDVALAQWERRLAGLSDRYEIQMLRPDGTGVWCRVSASPIWHGGRFDGVLAMYTDVTAERAAVEQLRESEERFRRFADHIDQVVWITTPDFGRALYISRQHERVTGFGREEFYRDPWFVMDRIHENDRALVRAGFERMRTGQPAEAEIRFQRRDGEWRWLRCRAFPVPGPDGSVSCLAGINEDITRQRLVEAAAERVTNRLEEEVRLRTAEIALTVARLEAEVAERRAVEAALRDSRQVLLDAERIGGLGSWTLNIASRRFTWSEGMFRVCGVTPESYDPAAQGGLPFVTPEDRPRVLEAIESGIQTGAYQVDFRLRRADGEIRSVSCRGEVRDAGTPRARLVGSFLDVTALRNASLALVSGRLRLRQILDAIPSHVAVTAPDGTIELINTACAAHHGYAAKDLVGKSYRCLCADDESYRTRRAEDDAVIASGRELLVGDRPDSGPDGDRLLQVVKRPLFEPDGRAGHVLYVATDVTEERRAADLLLETKKHASVGRMAARIAHEINNPLAGIKNAFQLIRTAIPEEHRYAHYVGRVGREIDRIAEIVRQMYDLYRPAPREIQPCDPADVALDVLELLERQVHEKTITLRTDLARGEAVLVPEHLLRPVVMNLVQNAIEAVSPGGAVAVRVAIEGGHLILEVTDDGPGVPAQHAGRILEPFFTTKSGSGGGLGLGLPTVNGLVSAMGGRLEFGNVAGRGARFRVAIPAQRGCGSNAKGDR